PKTRTNRPANRRQAHRWTHPAGFENQARRSRRRPPLRSRWPVRPRPWPTRAGPSDAPADPISFDASAPRKRPFEACRDEERAAFRSLGRVSRIPSLSTIVVAALLAVVPTLIYLVVLNWIDRYEKEPWTLLIAGAV